MSKKESDSKLLVALKEFGTDFLLSRLKNLYQDFLKNIKTTFHKLQRDIINSLILISIIITGLIFIFIALVFLLNEYLKLNFGLSFLIIGLFILFISFLISLYFKKEKKEE